MQLSKGSCVCFARWNSDQKRIKVCLQTLPSWERLFRSYEESVVWTHVSVNEQCVNELCWQQVCVFYSLQGMFPDFISGFGHWRGYLSSWESGEHHHPKNWLKLTLFHSFIHLLTIILFRSKPRAIYWGGRCSNNNGCNNGCIWVHHRNL